MCYFVHLLTDKYDKAGIQDNRGFRGKVCFKVKGAQSIEADYAGIARVTCEPMFGTCQGVGGGVFRDPAVCIAVSFASCKVNGFMRFKYNFGENKF